MGRSKAWCDAEVACAVAAHLTACDDARKGTSSSDNVRRKRVSKLFHDMIQKKELVDCGRVLDPVLPTASVPVIHMSSGSSSDSVMR